MLGWLARLLGRTPRREKPPAGERVRVVNRIIRGRYDAAQTTPENERHWANADSLSVNAATMWGVRWRLRNRARYECDNNGYASGMVSTLALDLVGTGPRLTVTLPEWCHPIGRDPQTGRPVAIPPDLAARAIELAWTLWDTAGNYSAELRILEECRNRDGEGFGVLISNPAMERKSGVHLDLDLVETDQVTTPGLAWVSPYQHDGIVLDQWGNRVEYHVLKEHPGDPYQTAGWQFDRIPADKVVHWFQPRRPQQQRGVPEITPALPLFAMLRRYTLATLSAAEIAAMLAGVMETDQPPDAGPVTVDAMDLIELERGGLITLPAGWKASQFKPEQPVTGYKEFKWEILAEIARAVDMPLNRLLGTNNGANYSSARLDNEIYQDKILCTRDQFRLRVHDPVFKAWLDEALLVPGLLPEGLPPVVTWQWAWNYKGFASSDPLRDAQADLARLGGLLTTLSELYAERGLDWQQALRQRARELALQRELGLADGEAVPPASAPAPATPDTPQAADQAANQPQEGVANGAA